MGYLKNLLSENPGRAKATLFGLAVAVLAFLVWSVSASREATAFVSVSVKGLPPGLVLSSLSPSGVEVKVSGPRYLLDTLIEAEHHVSVDAERVAQGVNRIQLQGVQFAFPDGVEVTEIHPDSIILEVEAAGQKEVPVMVAHTGKPGNGFVVADAVARPSSVVLRGPESQLASLDKAMTKPIDVHGITDSLRRQTSLDLPEAVAIESDASVFQAEIFIEEKRVTKRFGDIVVEGAGTSYSYSFRPETISIEINGPMNIVEKMTAEADIRAYVDLEGLSPGVYVRPVAISLPLNTMLEAATPEVFSVEIGPE